MTAVHAALALILCFGVRAHAQVWSSIGPPYLVRASNPQNFNAGRVSSIAVDPSDPDHWLIGVGNGGVWESHDAGGSWTPLTDAAPTLAIGAVAFAPSDPNIIYAATGEAALSGFTRVGLGILKSINGGRTWDLLAMSSFARTSVRRVRVHPLDANIVLAISARGGFGRDSQEGAPSPAPFGVLKSIDGGVTWSRTLAGQATALEIDSSNFNNQYAAIGEIRRGGVNNDTPGAAPPTACTDPPIRGRHGRSWKGPGVHHRRDQLPIGRARSRCSACTGPTMPGPRRRRGFKFRRSQPEKADTAGPQNAITPMSSRSIRRTRIPCSPVVANAAVACSDVPAAD